MDGPQHYREAEQRLADYNRGEANERDLAAAQVHATLATAPATNAELTDATEEVNDLLATWRAQSNRTRLSVELMDKLDALRVAVEGK